MSRIASSSGLLLVALLGLTACNSATPPDTFPGQPVTQRNAIFKQMLRSFEPIGLMLRGKQAYDADAVIGHADQLKQLSSRPWSHFPAGSDYAPTKAKAAIWEKPDDFKRAQTEFIGAAETLATVARSRNKDTLRSAHEAVYETCTACHKAFRR